MTYGLRILNDNSELLIDSEFVNPTFLEKLEFSTSPILTEPTDGQRHPDYIRRDYVTNIFYVPNGARYFIMWYLPDTMNSGQPDKDVWYQFSTSSLESSQYLTCSVYANTLGNPINYSLPTAYIFGINAAAINNMSSSGAALRMYNSQNVKTFDSNFTQLVPYSTTAYFNIPGGDTTTTLYLGLPNKAIFLLPKSAYLFAGDTGYGYSAEKVFDTCYRRRGQYIESRTISTSYSGDNPPINDVFAFFTAGNIQNLTVISADANLYETPNPGTGGGNNPTYLLSANTSPINEGQTLIITLTTTLVADGTNIGYSVTGINSADLISGGLTGNFVIYNNTATASFGLKNDLSIGEGTEIFKLSLTNLPTFIDVNILDTSKANVTYQFSTPSPINEGSSGYNTFSATNAMGKVVTFNIIAPTSGTAVNGLDGTLDTTTWTVPSNTTSSINVAYTANADQTTEGPEAFRLAAIVDGLDVAISGDITVNDTSKAPGYTISAANSWTEGTTNTVTITASNAPPGSIYINTSDSAAVPKAASLFVTGTEYIVDEPYIANEVTADTSVTLYVRTGSLNGPIVASKNITVLNIPATYSFGGVSAFNEGTTSSVVFSYNKSAGKTISFQVIAPEAGYVNGSNDVTLYTTTHTISDNNPGSVSVSYSAAADQQTEGPEGFRIIAVVDGSTRATTSTIIINDTSTALVASLTALNAPWTENTTQSTQFNIQGAQNKLVQLSSTSGLVSPYTSLYFVNSDNYTATTNWTVSDFALSTYVPLSLTDYYTGATLAQTTVLVQDIPPVPSYAIYNTWSTLVNNASSSFFLRSFNANGVGVSVSVSGSGASRVSVSPTYFSINSNAQTDSYIGIATTLPSSSVPEQSVTISLSTGQSFSFTIPAYNVSVTPLVTTVHYNGNPTTIYSGESVVVVVQFDNPITADLYVQIEINAGVYGTQTDTIVGGTQNSYAGFALGSTVGYFITVNNPGYYNTTLKAGARAITSGGSARQVYKYGPTISLSTQPPP